MYTGSAQNVVQNNKSILHIDNKINAVKTAVKHQISCTINCTLKYVTL